MNKLYSTDFNVQGRSMRAFYSADDNNLVFVLDFSVSDIKPNVLLVINPVDDRKWDDILSNDYGVDLETVRPKKDNKYQKLDIEYDGLGIYDRLFDAYDGQDDLNAILVQLDDFYKRSAKRIAQERLVAAEEQAVHANDTIQRTNQSIVYMKDKLKKLRADLSDAKRAIGTEPTKRSASRVLRIEAQMDATSEKLNRAQKRLQNAKKRLDTAGEDAVIARGILDKLNQTHEIIQKNKVENMADDEIKPLFDKDPNILDEGIAFKPIDFNTTENSEDVKKSASDILDIGINFVPVFDDAEKIEEEQDAFLPKAVSEHLPEVVQDHLPEVVTEKLPEVVPERVPEVLFDKLPEVVSEYPTDVENKDNKSDGDTVSESVVQPLAFVPPVSFDEIAEPVAEPVTEEVTYVTEKPVLDTFTPIATEQADLVTEDVLGDADIKTVATDNVSNNHVVAKVAEDAVRPASPIAEEAVVVDNSVSNKPTKIYYIMLVVLIVLSVFTLWLYQKSVTDDMVPELEAKTQLVQIDEEKESYVDTTDETVNVVTLEDTESPFIDVVSVADEEKTGVTEEVAEPVVAEVVESDVVQTVTADVPVVPDAPIVEETAMDATLVQALDAAIQTVDDATVVSEPVVTTDTVAEEVVAVESEPVVEKPVYNVSQQEKMFVASPDYETDTQNVCADNSAPDANGCCAGETATDVNGSMLCCVDGTDECFPPMI